MSPEHLPPEPVGAGSRSSKRKVGGYIGLVISIVCIIWVFGKVDINEVLGHIKGADISLLILAFITTAIGYVLRAWRWQYFFDSNPPNMRDSYRCLIMGFFVNNILPARAGEFVRAHLGGRATGQSRSIVLATIAGERLADGLAISLLFSVLFGFGATASELEGAKQLQVVALLFLVAALCTLLLLKLRERVFSILAKLGEIMPGSVSSYTLIRIRRFIVGLEPLMVPRRLFVLSVLSLVVWGTELLVYYEVTRAFGQAMSIGGLALFLAAVNFSALIPSGPGAIGVIELIAPMFLVVIGVEHATGLSMVSVQHLIQILVIGIPGSFYLFWHMGGRIPERDSDSDPEEVETIEGIEGFADVSTPRPESVDDRLEPAVLVNGHHTKHDIVVDLSVIVPAFNEDQRLPKTILEILEFLGAQEQSYEVLVVDDGSSDETAPVVHRFETLTPAVRLLTYPHNRGKGYAVRFGVLNARGKHILFTDADGSTPIEELTRLQAAMDSGAAIAIGSRALFSRETSVKTLWYRKALGRIYNAIANVILLPGIADTQCGFKMFEREVALAIFNEQREERFAFDVELLFLARKLGCQIAEVPVNWHNVPGSKVSLIRDSLAMLCSLIRIRLRNVFGAYSNLSLEKTPVTSTANAEEMNTLPKEGRDT